MTRYETDQWTLDTKKNKLTILNAEYISGTTDVSWVGTVAVRISNQFDPLITLHGCYIRDYDLNFNEVNKTGHNMYFSYLDK